jgi:transposase
VTLIWDGLTSHRSRAMLDYLDTQKHWLQVVSLPGYAPELNPVEGLWSSLKGRELANRCESTIGAVVDAANLGVARLRTAQLAFSFLDHTPLSF